MNSASEAARNFWSRYAQGLYTMPRAFAATADVPLTRQQMTTAAALTQYIYWRGRYVVPTERGIDDLIPIKHENGLVGPSEWTATVEAARDLILHVITEVKCRLYSA